MSGPPLGNLSELLDGTHNLWHNRKQHNYLCQRRIFSALSLRSQVANGQLNCLFSAIRTFKYFKSRVGQLCNFLDCATKPNDKFNAPLVLGPAGRAGWKGRRGEVAQQQPQPHVDKQTKTH